MADVEEPTPFAAGEMPSASTSWRKRPPRSAKERRAQAQRAQARVVQALLRSFNEVTNHRGGAPTALGMAHRSLLVEPPARAGATTVDSAAQTDHFHEEAPEAPTNTVAPLAQAEAHTVVEHFENA